MTTYPQPKAAAGVSAAKEILELADRYEKFGVQASVTRDEIKLIVAALRTLPSSDQCVAREALESLIKTASLLQQNSEGCAVKHHGLDFEQQGLPGWLIDTQKSIDAARAALTNPAPTDARAGE